MIMIANLCCAASFITSGFEDINVFGTTIPEDMIDAIFEYEWYIIMKEHFEMFKYVLQDI